MHLFTALLGGLLIYLFAPSALANLARYMGMRSTMNEQEEQARRWRLRARRLFEEQQSQRRLALDEARRDIGDDSL